MWARIIIDGLVMSAVFNLATGLIITVNPVFFTTAYPKAIQAVAPENPDAKKHQVLFTLFVMLPVTLFGVISAYLNGMQGFWHLFWAGYIEWFLINLGDFFGLDLFFRERMGERLQLPGTEGHPCYERKAWMKSLALPEHCLEWPLLVCPLFGFLSAGIGMLIRWIG